MNLIALDIDPATVSVRSRDTEHLPTEEAPSPWSDWQTVAELAALPGFSEVYSLVFLLASQLMQAGNFTGSVTVSCNVMGGDTPIRTIDYEIKLTG